MNKFFTMPRSRLAKALGISPTSAWNIIQKMKRGGELVSYFSNGRANIYIKKEAQNGKKK